MMAPAQAQAPLQAFQRNVKMGLKQSKTPQL